MISRKMFSLAIPMFQIMGQVQVQGQNLGLSSVTLKGTTKTPGSDMCRILRK